MRKSPICSRILDAMQHVMDNQDGVARLDYPSQCDAVEALTSWQFWLWSCGFTVSPSALTATHAKGGHVLFGYPNSHLFTSVTRRFTMLPDTATEAPTPITNAAKYYVMDSTSQVSYGPYGTDVAAGHGAADLAKRHPDRPFYITKTISRVQAATVTVTPLV